MPILQANLFAQLVSHYNTMNNTNSNSNVLRKLDFLNKYNNYARLVYPNSVTSDLAKISALASFVGDNPKVPKSYNLALSKALGTYASVLSTGMTVPPHVPSYIPLSAVLYPQLLPLNSVRDKISGLQSLATIIDSWMHTGISMNITNPMTPIPTPWV